MDRSCALNLRAVEAARKIIRTRTSSPTNPHEYRSPRVTVYATDKRNLSGPIIPAASFDNAWATTERFFAKCIVAEPPDEARLLYQPESIESAGLAMIVERYGEVTTTPCRNGAGAMWHGPAEELAQVAAFVAGLERAVGTSGSAQILFNRAFR